MEIGSFPPERIRGDHTLGFELVVTYRATKFDLTQRRDGRTSYPLSLDLRRRG